MHEYIILTNAATQKTCNKQKRYFNPLRSHVQSSRGHGESKTSGRLYGYCETSQRIYLRLRMRTNSEGCMYVHAMARTRVHASQWRIYGGGQLPPPPPFSSLPFSFLLVVCVVTVHTTPALHGARRSPPKYVAQKARASPVGDSPTPATILKYTYS